MTDRSVLADPVNAALSGPHARFRLSAGRIQRYHPDVSVFYGHPRALTDEDYADVARLTGGRSGRREMQGKARHSRVRLALLTRCDQSDKTPLYLGFY